MHNGGLYGDKHLGVPLIDFAFDSRIYDPVELDESTKRSFTPLQLAALMESVELT